MPGKSPKCGNNMVHESSESLEYAGIIPILNKVIEITSKYPFWGKVDVYPHYLSSDPVIEVITDMENPSQLSVQINEADLKKKKLVSNFKALYAYGGLTSKWESDAQFKWVTVNGPKVASKIVCEILTKVYQKDLKSARFVITDVDGYDTDKATYNSSGEFITGIGYGKGEFANYKQPTNFPKVQEYNEINGHEWNIVSNIKKIACVIAFIVLGFILWNKCNTNTVKLTTPLADAQICMKLLDDCSTLNEIQEAREVIKEYISEYKKALNAGEITMSEFNEFLRNCPNEEEIQNTEAYVAGL